MSVRGLVGSWAVPTFAGHAGSASYLTRKVVTGENEILSQFIAIAGRSAELCPTHFTGQTLRKFYSRANRNSGQRAASGCSTRREPFQPIRPGLPAEPSGYLLRFAVADLAGTLTAKGIGVR